MGALESGAEGPNLLTVARAKTQTTLPVKATKAPANVPEKAILGAVRNGTVEPASAVDLETSRPVHGIGRGLGAGGKKGGAPADTFVRGAPAPDVAASGPMFGRKGTGRSSGRGTGGRGGFGGKKGGALTPAAGPGDTDAHRPSRGAEKILEGQRGGNSSVQSVGRRILIKFLHDGTINFSRAQLEPFAQAICAFDPPELLHKLTNQEEKRHLLAQRRLREAVAECNKFEDIEKIVVPILTPLVGDTLQAPMYAHRCEDLLRFFFELPFFIQMLEEVIVKETLGQKHIPSLEVLCRFMTLLARAFIEARHSKPLQRLALAMLELKVPASERLCALLNVQPAATSPPTAVPARISSPHAKPTLVRTEQLRPPGERHDNDFANFRDIAIIPTAAEVLCADESYLPLANGSNRIIADDESALLDKHFRLLRADMLEPLREMLLSKRQAYKNARVVDIDLALPGTEPRGRRRLL